MAVDIATCGGTGPAGATFVAALQFFAASQCLLQETWPKHATVKNGTRFDFIVVGGGTAGSVMAARLSELPGFSVLLVEAGGNPPQESIIPGYKDTMKASRYDWNFTTVNDNFSSQALQDGSQRQPRGKMLGGTGSINDMVYARGFPVDYDEWESIIGGEWSWTKVLEYFKKTEHLTDERIINDPDLSELHGFKGEIEVSGLNESTYTTDRFMEAFEEVGFQVVNDMTSYKSIGVGRFSHTIRRGQRDSSLTALLNNASVRNNLIVLRDALVTRILIENKTAVGIKVVFNEDEFDFYADEEVILSAGTFNTPKLLLLSGIGPRKHLAELEIDVIQDLPVGNNLHDHIMVLNYLATENGTCYTDDKSTYMNAIKYLYDRSGSFARTSDLGVYISEEGLLNRNVPEFAIYPTCIPQGSDFYEGCLNVLGFKQKICEKLDEINKNYELLSLAVVRLKPKSRGKVRLMSTNPLDEPLIYSGTFSDRGDLEGFPEAMKIAWSIKDTKHFRKKKTHVIDIEVDECDRLGGVSKIKCIARTMAMSAWHSVGTAAMGKVVDEKLKVKGMKRLRVVDASVMPKIIRGNSNAPVVMIAERAADFIKESLVRT